MAYIRIFAKLCILIAIALSAWQCSTTKKLSDNQALLVEQNLLINGELTQRHPSQSILSTQPNKKFIGFPLGLHIYNLSSDFPETKFDTWLNKKPKREQRLNNLISPKQVQTIRRYKSFFNRWLKNTGEPPQVIDSSLIKESIDKLKQYFESQGYFSNEVSYNINKNAKQHAILSYSVNTNTQYFLDSIKFSSVSPKIDSLLEDNRDKMLIRSGYPVNLIEFQNERTRIIDFLRNNGIYNYQPNSLKFQLGIDSLGIDASIPVVVNIGGFQQNIGAGLAEVIPYKPYTISDISIYVDSIDDEEEIIEYTDSIQFNRYNIYSRAPLKYKPKVLTEGIEIQFDSIYKDSERTRTYRYFTSLNNFRYPRIEYHPTSPNGSDLETIIRLVPNKRFNLGFELDFSTSEIQDFGIGTTFTFEARNPFKGAEILQLNFNNVVGASNDLPNTTNRFFNLFDTGANLTMTIPKVLLPFGINRMFSADMLPRTRILFGTNVQSNIGLDKQFYDFTYQFEWNPTSKTTMNFKLFDLEYVFNRNIQNFFNVYRTTYGRLNDIARKYEPAIRYQDDNRNLLIPEGALDFFSATLSDPPSIIVSQNDYRSLINLRERYDRLVDNNLILGSSLDIAYSSQEGINDENYHRIKGKLNLAGTFLNDFVLQSFGDSKNANNRYEVAGVEPSQFVKFEFEYVKQWNLGSRNILAFRQFGGVAIPFGNSTNIPFSQSYFAGGSNDNRAWRVYSLGPGSSSDRQELNEANFKLLSSLEYRFPLVGSLNGALFVDAGNIWNVFDDIADPEFRFSGIKDLSELAVGTGIGLRYDFKFFVLRFDTAFKAHNPALPIHQRWWSGIALNQAVFNIGINYPF